MRNRYGLFILAAILLLLGACQSDDTQSSTVQQFVTVTPPTLVASGSLPAPAAESQNQPIVQAAPVASPVNQQSSQGQVMVLEYHLIGAEGDINNELQRTVDRFRADMVRLYDLGYTPANIIDLVRGFPDLPPGRKPVVLTFDDSDISQFRILADGTLDPNSAVGILYNFHLAHPEDWPLKGTFYVLQDVGSPERILFGQPELADQKLRWLIEMGFEVGSHTVSHFDLASGDGYQVQEELARSKHLLEARLPGYEVRSLSVPFGSFPLNPTFLVEGWWDGAYYSYDNNVMAWGGPAPSPHSPEFDAYRIPRLVVTDQELDYWLTYFQQNPEAYYISTGPGERQLSIGE